MEAWAIQLVISLGGVIVTLGSVIALLKGLLKPSSNPGNSGLEKRFTDQVATCSERFTLMARESGEVEATLKSIDNRLERIEAKL